MAVAPRFFLPAEDAVILFQYSRNLAEHGAITYLAGGPHTEGATDFAWMVLIAAAERLGVAPVWFSAATNVACLLALSVLLLKLARLPVRVDLILTVCGCAALFPQIFAAASGFAVLPDALLLATLVYFVRQQDAIKASLVALIFCLFRPDGIVLAVPLLMLMMMSSRKWQQTAKVGTLYVLPGLVYFLWRWHYFRELLPLPFLVKSDAQRVFGLFNYTSLRTSLIFLIFAAVVLYPLLRSWKNSFVRYGLILMVIPTLFYWTFRLDQNVGGRFFYYLPLGTALLLAMNWSEALESRHIVLRTACVAWLVLLAMPLYREFRTFRDMQFALIKTIAEELHNIPGGVIATSEAGFLPYYSGWKTVDLWGLNNSQFAHKFFQPGDLSAINPDLLVLHADRMENCLVQADWQASYSDRSWPYLIRNAVIAAKPSKYDLWLTSYGSEYYRLRKHWSYGEGDRECWFVRKDSVHYPQVAAILTRHHGIAPIEAVRMEVAHSEPPASDKLGK